jgi:hypothetical protein
VILLVLNGWFEGGAFLRLSRLKANRALPRQAVLGGLSRTNWLFSGWRCFRWMVLAGETLGRGDTLLVKAWGTVIQRAKPFCDQGTVSSGSWFAVEGVAAVHDLVKRTGKLGDAHESQCIKSSSPRR